MVNCMWSALDLNWGHKRIISYIRFLTIILTLILLPLAPALAEPSCEELNRLWLTKYHKEFKIIWRKQSFICNDNKKSAEYRTALAIYYLDHLRQIENGKEVGFNYYDYVAGPNSPLIAIQKARDTTNRNFSTSSAYYNIYLGYNFYNGPGTPIFLGAKLVHERRHMDGNNPDGINHSHVVCTQGDMKGKKSCDRTFRLGKKGNGAYGFSLDYVIFALQKANTEARIDLNNATLKGIIYNLLNNHFRDLAKKDRNKILYMIGLKN